jgi:hypothetical protein
LFQPPDIAAINRYFAFFDITFSFFITRFFRFGHNRLPALHCHFIVFSAFIGQRQEGHFSEVRTDNSRQAITPLAELFATFHCEIAFITICRLLPPMPPPLQADSH